MEERRTPWNSEAGRHYSVCHLTMGVKCDWAKELECSLVVSLFYSLRPGVGITVYTFFKVHRAVLRRAESTLEFKRFYSLSIVLE